MALEVHESVDGTLSVWRDPYEWVDPFAEAEMWALAWAKGQRTRDAEIEKATEQVAAHVHAIRLQLDALSPLRPRPEVKVEAL